jgi:hypothetical protein
MGEGLCGRVRHRKDPDCQENPRVIEACERFSPVHLILLHAEAEPFYAICGICLPVIIEALDESL